LNLLSGEAEAIALNKSEQSAPKGNGLPSEAELSGRSSKITDKSRAFRESFLSAGTVAPMSAQGLRSSLSAGSSIAAVLRQKVPPGGEEVAAMESSAEVPCDRDGKGEAQTAM
jgi:hypothetical protein